MPVAGRSALIQNFSRRASALLLLFVFLVTGACAVNPPLEEYTIARTALLAARRAEANRLSPSHFHSAEEAYNAGEAAYKDQSYGEAKNYFMEAAVQAEKAENLTRLQKFEAGDVAP